MLSKTKREKTQKFDPFFFFFLLDFELVFEVFFVKLFFSFLAKCLLKLATI